MKIKHDYTNIAVDVVGKINRLIENKPELNSILRVEIKIPETDPLSWLYSQRDEIRIFFSGRENRDFEIAGAGAVETISSSDFKNLEKCLNTINSKIKNTNLKYYGGISFPEDQLGTEWSEFEKIKFVLPKFEIIKKNRSSIFACNFKYTNNFTSELNQLELDLSRLKFDKKYISYKVEKPIENTCIPDYSKWKSCIEKVTGDIDSGLYNKIVIARKVMYKFKHNIDPVNMLINFKRNLFCRYDFLFQFNKNTSFIGSSMERFYKREDREIRSEAIAGSIQRGIDEKSDEKLANELLNSDKDNKEQGYVVEFIKNKLSDLCESINQSNKKEILKLRESSHLKSDFTGILKENVTDARIIQKLHPTPAVGGAPWEIVSKLIARYELFSRGWYAGLVGYIGDESSDFSVALRSGLIYNETLTLFTGVGIVNGSEPKKEWEEGNWKIKNYEELFT